MRHRSIVGILVILFLVYDFTIVHAQLTDRSIISTSGYIVSSIHSMLYVDGTILRDASGDEFRLRGVTIGWNGRMKVQGTANMASRPEDTWFTEDDVIRIKQAGANTVDILSIWTREVMPQRDIVDENFVSTWIDKWVSWCTENELYCVIGFRGFANYHVDWLVMPVWLYRNPDGSFMYPFGKPDTLEEQAIVVHDFWDYDVSMQEVNRVAWIDAWKYLANRYKDNRYVIFSLVNEPLLHTHNQMTWEKSIHLGEAYSRMAERLIDGIRSTGAKQVIIVDRPYTRSYDHIVRIDRDDFVWEGHAYVGTEGDFNGWKSVTDLYISKFLDDFGQPFIQGEYSFDPPTLAKQQYPDTWQTILSDMVDYMDSQPMVGRIWHDWEVLEREYMDYEYDYFTEEESEFIIQTVLGR